MEYLAKNSPKDQAFCQILQKNILLAHQSKHCKILIFKYFIKTLLTIALRYQ